MFLHIYSLICILPLCALRFALCALWQFFQVHKKVTLTLNMKVKKTAVITCGILAVCILALTLK